MQTDLSFLDNGQPWPPTDEAERIKGMTENIDIFDGKRDSFLVMKNWMDKDAEAKPKKLHIKVPLPEKAVGVVLNGALPELKLSLASEESDKAFQAWLKSDRFGVTLEEAGTDWCRCGVGVVKVSRSGERVKARAVRPDCWIPVCYPDDDREFQYHVLFKEWAEDPEGGSKIKWLKVEIHSETAIEYRLYQIEESGKLARKDLSEKNNLFEGYDLDGNDSQTTAGWCVFPIWNSRTSDKAYGIPDASFSSEALSHVESMELSFSQMRFILSQHSKPVTVVHPDAIKRDPDTDRVKFDPEKTLIHKAYEMSAKDMVAYVASPVEAIDLILREINATLQLWVNCTEISAPMMSGVDAANVASGRALMLELTPTMDHLRRFRAAFWDVIPQILEAASRLALPESGLPKITAGDVKMDWELSVASDPTETAERLGVLHRERIYSTEECLRQLGHDADEIKAIMGELAKAEQSQAVQNPGEEPLQIELPSAGGVET
ncbi:MAG: hypothetical protein QM433_04400, partial [Euryarchaeota archaeon]|nr:hypothetical protein [Euryarchaeota archaeon]